MSYWISDLVRVPGLGVQLMAGSDGLDQRGPIRRASVVDESDPTRWLSGGELILISPAVWGATADAQRLFIERLVHAGAVGLCVQSPRDSSLPAVVLEVCDEQLLPLLLCPAEVPLLAVASTVADQLAIDYDRRLANALDLNRSVVDAVVGERGVKGVLDVVGRVLDGCVLVAYEYSGDELARYDPEKRLQSMGSDEVWTALRDGSNDLHGYGVEVDRVMRGPHLEALVGLITEREIDPFERLIFQQAVGGVAMNFSREQSRRTSRRNRVSRLLDQAIGNRIPAPKLVEEFVSLGFEPSTPWRMACIAVSDPAEIDVVSAAIEDAFGRFRQAAVGSVAQHVFLVMPETASTSEALAEAMDRVRHLRLRAGVSRVKVRAEALPAAYREASVASRLGTNTINQVEALGVEGLVAGLSEDLGGRELVRVVLGPLTGSGKPPVLLETLEAYLANACRSGPTATQLNIHRHTLTYRLERITALTGLDPRDGRNLLPFSLAIEIQGKG